MAGSNSLASFPAPPPPCEPTNLGTLGWQDVSEMAADGVCHLSIGELSATCGMEYEQCLRFLAASYTQAIDMSAALGACPETFLGPDVGFVRDATSPQPCASCWAHCTFVARPR